MSIKYISNKSEIKGVPFLCDIEPSHIKCDSCKQSFGEDEITYNTDGPTYCIYCTD